MCIMDSILKASTERPENCYVQTLAGVPDSELDFYVWHRLFPTTLRPPLNITAVYVRWLIAVLKS